MDDVERIDELAETLTAHVVTVIEDLQHKAATLDKIVAALNDEENEYSEERLSAVESILLAAGFDIIY